MGKLYFKKSAIGLYERIIVNPIMISFIVFLGALSFVMGLTFKLYNISFLRDVLVEAHGMLFDILVIGILILWLNERGRKRLEIQRYNDEIDDFRGWKSEEAAHRIRGNIMRLTRRKVTKINLFNCCLKSINLSNINLQGVNLMGANLERAFLMGTNLSGAKLVSAYLYSAFLNNSNLKDALLLTVDLRNADLMGVNLERAMLEGTDLRGARNLTIEQLSKAKTLYNAKLNAELMEEIKKDYPHLLGKPNDAKE